MNGIIVRENESFEKSMRRFIKTCDKSGVLSELKKYRHFEKPSEKRQRKLNTAKQQRLKNLRLENTKKNKNY